MNEDIIRFQIFKLLIQLIKIESEEIIMTKRVIVLNFDISSQAYQAFSKIKKLHLSQEIKGEQMAVITHSSEGDHQFKVEDFLDFTGANKTSKGGLIGMLVGVLGGPLGMMLGWFGGSLFGASKDAQELREAHTIFEFVGNKIGEGDTGLILIADEEDNRPLNNIAMYELGGEISRFDLDEVEAEIKKAHEVEAETKENAQKIWEEKHPND